MSSATTRIDLLFCGALPGHRGGTISTLSDVEFLQHVAVVPYRRCRQDTSKHVQTELTVEEYEAVREFATERGLTLKESTRTALVEWVERQCRADPSDPAFTVLDDFEDESLGQSAETDARTEADLVDEWTGDDVEFRLAETPTNRE
jgi:hypothetical protein